MTPQPKPPRHLLVVRCAACEAETPLVLAPGGAYIPIRCPKKHTHALTVRYPTGEDAVERWSQVLAAERSA